MVVFTLLFDGNGNLNLRGELVRRKRAIGCRNAQGSPELDDFLLEIESVVFNGKQSLPQKLVLIFDGGLFAF